MASAHSIRGGRLGPRRALTSSRGALAGRLHAPGAGTHGLPAGSERAAGAGFSVFRGPCARRGPGQAPPGPGPCIPSSHSLLPPPGKMCQLAARAGLKPRWVAAREALRGGAHPAWPLLSVVLVPSHPDLEGLLSNRPAGPDPNTSARSSPGQRVAGLYLFRNRGMEGQ